MLDGVDEGEWNARKHGGAKRRVWRKVHLGVDEETLEISAAEVTSSDIGDAPTLPELLSQIPPDQEIASATVDGATTRASATTPSPNGVLMPSFLRARTPSP